MKKLLTALAIVVGVALPTSAPVEAHHYSYIWLGEFQNCQQIAVCRDHLVPPTKLHINLYEGWLNGVDPGTRCANMGGVLAHRSDFGWVCYDVDY